MSSAHDVGSERGHRAHALFLDVQDKITDTLAGIDGGPGFRTDEWRRPEGGGGRTRIIEGGAVFEKGGVAVSLVHGELSEAFARELPGEGRRFLATGISLVIHPRSPRVPTVHANFRYLERGDAEHTTCWFGGGSDLTPWVLFEEDAVHFHRVWRDVNRRHAVGDWPRFKKWCDEYFHLAHRGESRGIGGFFFDYLGLPAPKGTPADPEDAFSFVRDGAGSFLDAYMPIVARRKDERWTEAERDWQLRRRSRYVEFNLLYDRGTTFGLRTGGRVESILMSLPNLVSWKYDDKPEPGTYQEQLVEALRQPRDWLAGVP
jgi:coproporphyrinogen III oxidase